MAMSMSTWKCPMSSPVQSSVVVVVSPRIVRGISISSCPSPPSLPFRSLSPVDTAKCISSHITLLVLPASFFSNPTPRPRPASPLATLQVHTSLAKETLPVPRRPDFRPDFQIKGTRPLAPSDSCVPPPDPVDLSPVAFIVLVEAQLIPPCFTFPAYAFSSSFSSSSSPNRNSLLLQNTTATVPSPQELMSVDLRQAQTSLRFPSRVDTVTRAQISRVHTGDITRPAQLT